MSGRPRSQIPVAGIHKKLGRSDDSWRTSKKQEVSKDAAKGPDATSNSHSGKAGEYPTPPRTSNSRDETVPQTKAKEHAKRDKSKEVSSLRDMVSDLKLDMQKSHQSADNLDSDPVNAQQVFDEYLRKMSDTKKDTGISKSATLESDSQQIQQLKDRIKELEQQKRDDDCRRAHLCNANQKLEGQVIKLELETEASEAKHAKELEEKNEDMERLWYDASNVQDAYHALLDEHTFFAAETKVAVSSREHIEALREEIKELNKQLVAECAQSKAKDVEHTAQINKLEEKHADRLSTFESLLKLQQEQINDLIEQSGARSMRHPALKENADKEPHDNTDNLQEELHRASSSDSATAEQQESSDDEQTPYGETIIIIKIDPADRSNWSWTQKMKAALPKKPDLVIDGPEEEVQKLREQMDRHEKDFIGVQKEVGNLRKEVANAEKQVMKLQKTREKDAESADRLVAKTRDEIAAKDAQNDMNNSMLRSYANKIRELESRISSQTSRVSPCKRGPESKRSWRGNLGRP